MPWPCYMVECCPSATHHYLFRHNGQIVPWKELAPGAMWFDPDDPSQLCVKLPGGSMGNEWNIDRGRQMNAQPERAGKKPMPQWTRWGDEPPKITVHPSINWEGHYHGWLTDGVLTEDLEGRKLGPMGEPLPAS